MSGAWGQCTYPDRMNVLGISDSLTSGAAILTDGKVRAVISEELLALDDFRQRCGDIVSKSASQFVYSFMVYRFQKLRDSLFVKLGRFSKKLVELIERSFCHFFHTSETFRRVTF